MRSKSLSTSGIVAVVFCALLAACAGSPGSGGTGSGATSDNADIYPAPKQEVRVGTVEYAAGIKGFHARPTGSGSFPGVVMIHEWWGLNENIRTMAARLASEGYDVLAVDLYGGKVASTADEAKALTGGLDQAKATANLQAAARYLRVTQKSPRLASLGWCFGGGQSLKLAMNQPKEAPLDAAVIYYGQLETDSAKLTSMPPTLGIFGEEDTSIPVKTVTAFDEALRTNDIEHSVHLYPGVGHAFANPSGQNYAPKETRDAWLKTLAFLDDHLR